MKKYSNYVTMYEKNQLNLSKSGREVTLKIDGEMLFFFLLLK